MDKFDKYLKNKSNSEDREFILPKSFEDKLEETLGKLEDIDSNKKKWYKNKKVLSTAACIAFVSLVAVSANINLSKSNFILGDVEKQNQQDQLTKSNIDSRSIHMGNEARESGFSLEDNINNNIININGINKLIFKSMNGDNEYKVIDKHEDIEKVIQCINEISKEKIEKQNINQWDYLIETSGVDSNHYIIIKNNIMEIDNEYYKIDLQDTENLKNIYNELNYNKNKIPNCDY